MFILVSPNNRKIEVVRRGGPRRAIAIASQRAKRSRAPVIVRELRSTSPLVAGKRIAYAEPNGNIALGDTLTDALCDQQGFARSWQQRLNAGLSTGAQAAVIGGAAAGLLAALIGRPILGVAVGAATSWAAHAIWTAPLRP